jgi:methyltransferase (TIGR00027 family)
VDAQSTASQTALMVAAYRARASRRERPVCTDPWAEAIAGAAGHEIAARFDERYAHMELWIALRVAYLDSLVGAAVDQLGARQIVILGAGYDTRAARLPRAGVRFFEVDHPATQAAKLAEIERLRGYPVDAATYVSCLFGAEDPIDRLVAAGFATTEPALVIWEGVVPYLPEAAVRATAGRLGAALDPRSLVAFDFVSKKLATGQGVAEQDLATRDYIGGLGEPILFGTDDPLPLLYECGFHWVRVLDFNELALEFVGDYARERQFRFQRIALAAPRPPTARWP